MALQHDSLNQGRSFKRLLLTGRTGGVGRATRQRVAGSAQCIRISDLPGTLNADTAPAEELAPCDLADRQAVHALVAGCDANIHLGGMSVERPFEEILEANVKGVFHLYEAARRRGVKLIVLASSNHVTGFYRQDEGIDASARKRPGDDYGLSESFGKGMAQLYFDRYGIETVRIRVGSVFPEPKDRRMMATWTGNDDFHDLLKRALFAPAVGHAIVFSVSAIAYTWWDNREATRPGFQPHDSSEQLRDKIEAMPRPAVDDPAAMLQGGAFTAVGPFNPLPPVQCMQNHVCHWL